MNNDEANLLRPGDIVRFPWHPHDITVVGNDLKTWTFDDTTVPAQVPAILIMPRRDVLAGRVVKGLMTP